MSSGTACCSSSAGSSDSATFQPGSQAGFPCCRTSCLPGGHSLLHSSGRNAARAAWAAPLLPV